MSKQPLIWYVVADGGHARILARDSSGFAEILAIDSADLHHKSSDLGSDRPGRSFESVGLAHHAIAPRSDRHRRAGVDFAQTVAETLNDVADLGTFSKLILVAPAKTVRAIKAELTNQTSARLEGEYYKDLVKLPEAELLEHLVALTTQYQ